MAGGGIVLIGINLRDVSCVFTEPCLLPSAGGIILACRAAGNEVSEQMIENLRTAQHMRV